MGGEVFVSGFLVFTAATSALIFWVGYCFRPASWRKSLFKTISVSGLAAASFVMQGPWALTAALCACALGDYLLALDKERAFLAGVGAFALGHVFYITMILGHPLSDLAFLRSSPQGWLVASLAALAMLVAVVLVRKAGDLRYAVVAYVPLIVGMGISALTLPAEGVLVYVVFGALMFVLSDLVLALEKFVLRDGTVVQKLSPFIVWGTYWFAQAFLLAGLGA